MKIQKPTVKYIVDKRGRRKGVLLAIDQYEKLIEDIHDLTVIAQRENEKTISFGFKRKS
jgi:hypothetical protein